MRVSPLWVTQRVGWLVCLTVVAERPTEKGTTVMAVKKLILKATIARRLPDPNFSEPGNNFEHWVGFIRAQDLVPDVSYGPNARKPNTRRSLYQKVQNSLRNIDCEANTFHLKNNGITINAKSVRKGREGYRDIDGQKYGFIELEVHLPDEEAHGILNGGHTYEIAVKELEAGNIPPRQHIPFFIRTGVPDAWLPEIAGGLNTSLQVQDMSLDDLAGAFEWIKDELKGMPYYDKIAWSENDPGVFDARDIVSIIGCFDIEGYPNKDPECPVECYEKKSKVLDAFRNDAETNNGKRFKKLRPILKDILKLYDMIAAEFPEIHNKANKGKSGALGICDHRNGKPYEFVFSGKKGKTRLMTGALYPLLGAFRWMVELDAKSGTYFWRGGFKAVEQRWQATAQQLIRTTLEKARETNNSPNAMGKSRTHWGTLHQTVGFADLMQNQRTS
jgi:hypothetical protein